MSCSGKCSFLCNFKLNVKILFDVDLYSLNAVPGFKSEN